MAATRNYKSHHVILSVLGVSWGTLCGKWMIFFVRLNYRTILVAQIMSFKYN